MGKFLLHIFLIQIQHLIELVQMMKIIIVQQFEFRFCYLTGIFPGIFYLTDGFKKIGSGFGIGIQIFKFFNNLLSLFEVFCVLFFLFFAVLVIFFAEDSNETGKSGKIGMLEMELFRSVSCRNELAFLIFCFVVNQVIRLFFQMIERSEMCSSIFFIDDRFHFFQDFR